MNITWLYAPGDRPDVVRKAIGSGADVVIADLEDAVAPDRKRWARDAMAELLSQCHPVAVHVRINALDGPLAADDVRAVAALPGVSGLRLPKVVSPSQVEQIAAAVSSLTNRRMELHCLLESAMGVERAFEIATAHPWVAGIALGEVDLGADLGVTEEDGLSFARSRVILAARAAGLPPVAQSVYPRLSDLEGLAASCERGRRLGMFGRAALHPRQLPVIVRAYQPSAEQVEWANGVVAASAAAAGASAMPDGGFVDAAVLAQANRLLRVAGRHGTRSA